MFISISEKYSINKIAKVILTFLAILLIFNIPVLYAGSVPAATDEYSPRAAKDGRTVILHGDFSKNGENKSIIVIPSDQNGNSKTVSVGANSHSSVGGWDSIETDCFNPERGYYKTTLHLKGGVNYQFKMEQKSSAGIKDVWYGLDGYMSRFDSDSFNGGSDNNINLFLKHDDDVTFFFIDGDRGSFVEWQPAPPHQEYNQPGTKFHLITVSTKIKNNIQGLRTAGNSGNNIFDNFSGGSWRWRDAFSPVWYSLTSLPESGEIGNDGADIFAGGQLYMFRRTDVGEIGMYGKWQLDNDIANPAKDKNSDYWKNTGAFFSKAENFPKLRIADSVGQDMSFALPYAADEKQPRHEEGANNIVFEGQSKIENAGVYTYYMDEMNLDGTLTDDAQNFTAYPRHPAQSIYLPTITLNPVNQPDSGNTSVISGQIYGQNKLNPERNTVYILLTATKSESAEKMEASGFEKIGDKYQKLYSVTADAQGLWTLSVPLPNAVYEAKAFADVFTPQLIDPLSRNFSKDIYFVENTDGVNDLNTSGSYAGQPYLKDFIEAKNAENLYSAFGDKIIAHDSRIYEMNAEKNPVAIGTGFDSRNRAASDLGTHTRSAVLDTGFTVNVIFDSSKSENKNTVIDSSKEEGNNPSFDLPKTEKNNKAGAPKTGESDDLNLVFKIGAICLAVSVFFVSRRRHIDLGV